jgi:hypothetical protein
MPARRPGRESPPFAFLGEGEVKTFRPGWEVSTPLALYPQAS